MSEIFSFKGMVEMSNLMWGWGGMAAFIFGSNLPIFWKICRYFNYGLALCMKIFQLWLYAYQTKARNPGIQ